MGTVIQFPARKPRPRDILWGVHMRALAFIKARLAETGAWPTYAEIAVAAGVGSRLGAARVVDRLFKVRAIDRPDRLPEMGERL